MNRGLRAALCVVLAIAVAGTATLGFATATVVRAGTVSVKIDEHHADGADFTIWAPAFLIDLATPFVGAVIPPEARAELEPWLPAVNALADELEEIDDVVFVKVSSADETVRIAKENGRLVIHVESASETVHVSVPFRSVARLVRALDNSVA